MPAPESQDAGFAGVALAQLWARLDELVQEGPRVSDLVHHRLHLFAARRLRRGGEPVPAEFMREEQARALLSMMAPHVLGRVRESVKGPILLIKGPEVAAWYPDPELRPFTDLDLLVPDPEAVQRALLRAGFEEVGEPDLYRHIHHLRPVRWPELPLLIEVHSKPKWPTGTGCLPTEELFRVAVPSSTGMAGIETVPAEYHALLLAAHSWAHEPLGRLIELVDVAALTRSPAVRLEADGLARRAGVERLWKTTMSTADALLGDGHPSPVPLRVWARHLRAVRRRTVLEVHLERWLAPFWALPPPAAASVSLAEFGRDLTPAGAEGWPRKLRRTALSLRNFKRAQPDHERMLEHRDE